MKYTRTKKTVAREKKYHHLWIIFFVLLAANVLVGVGSSTTGVDLAYIEDKTIQLKNENRNLSQELINSTSLALIEDRASDLGFSSPTFVVYAGHKEPVAKLP